MNSSRPASTRSGSTPTTTGEFHDHERRTGRSTQPPGPTPLRSVEMDETEIVGLIVDRAQRYETGNWLARPNFEVAGVLWGIAHDIDCACEDSTIDHLDQYRTSKIGAET